MDVEVIFDGVEDDAELGFASTSSLSGAFASVGVVADQITEAAMRFVPEGTSFEVVRIAVVGGIVLVILSFVKGILSLILTVGTIGFGTYVYSNVYGKTGSGTTATGGGKVRSGGRRGAAEKKKPAESSPAGNILTSLFNSSDSWKTDDGLLDVTFKKPNKSNTKKRR